MYKKANTLKTFKMLFLATGIAFFCLKPKITNAQKDKENTLTDNTKRNVSQSILLDSIHSPKKAMLLSAIIPGSGQGYNKKYWKVPIIYAGFASLGYSFIFNNSKFYTYKNEYIHRKLNPTLKANIGEYSTEELNLLQESYRRNRDLSVIGVVIFYAINIIDAGVDAHLINFNVDENLSIKFQPTFYQTCYKIEPAAGLNLTWKF